MTLVNALSHSTDSGVGGAYFSPPEMDEQLESHERRSRTLAMHVESHTLNLSLQFPLRETRHRRASKRETRNQSRAHEPDPIPMTKGHEEPENDARGHDAVFEIV